MAIPNNRDSKRFHAIPHTLQTNSLYNAVIQPFLVLFYVFRMNDLLLATLLVLGILVMIPISYCVGGYFKLKRLTAMPLDGQGVTSTQRRSQQPWQNSLRIPDIGILILHIVLLLIEEAQVASEEDPRLHDAENEELPPYSKAGSPPIYQEPTSEGISRPVAAHVV